MRKDIYGLRVVRPEPFVCNRFAEAVAGVAVKSALTTKRDDDERE